MTKKIRFQLTVLYAIAGLNLLMISQKSLADPQVEFIKNQKQRVVVLTDNGQPPLYSYRRIIITIEDK